MTFGWTGAAGWLLLGGLVGLGGGALVYRASLKIKPLRAQRQAN